MIYGKLYNYILNIRIPWKIKPIWDVPYEVFHNDRHDMAEILLKVALSTLTLNLYLTACCCHFQQTLELTQFKPVDCH